MPQAVIIAWLYAYDGSSVKTNTAIEPQPYFTMLGDVENINGIWAVKDEVIFQNVVIRDLRSLGGIGVRERK